MNVRPLHDRLVAKRIDEDEMTKGGLYIPDSAKEKAILELLATDQHQLDAVVQCGTNMSLINVTEKLEPVIGIPILGINAVTFWYALRENGFEGPLVGGGRLLYEF